MDLFKYLHKVDKVRVKTKEGLIFEGGFVFSDYMENIIIQDNRKDFVQIPYKKIKKLYVLKKNLLFHHDFKEVKL